MTGMFAILVIIRSNIGHKFSRFTVPYRWVFHTHTDYTEIGMEAV